MYNRLTKIVHESIMWDTRYRISNLINYMASEIESKINSIEERLSKLEQINKDSDDFWKSIAEMSEVKK